MPDDTYPDGPYILRLLQTLVREYTTRDQFIRMFRRLRFLEEPVTIPAAYKATATEIRVPSSAEINWRIVGTLMSGKRIITVPSAGKDPEDREESTQKEDWTMESHRRINKQQGRDIGAMVVDQQVADGVGYTNMLLRTDSWYGYPEREDDEVAKEYLSRVNRWKLGAAFPIYHRDVDPLMVYPAKSGDGTDAVLTISYRSRRDLDTRYPYKIVNGQAVGRDLGPPEPPTGSTTATGLYAGSVYAPVQRFIEYWERPQRGKDYGWAVYMVGDEVVRAFKHKYSRVPYFELRGQQTPSTNRGYESLPVLFPYYWGLIGLNALLTMKMNASFMWAYPVPFVNTSADSPVPSDMIQTSPQLEAGKMWRGQPGQTLGFLANPGTIVDLDETIRYLQNQLDRLLAPVLYGIGGYQQPGYTVSQLQNSALTVFRPLTDNQENWYEEITEHEWRCIEVWGEDIYLPVPARGKRAGKFLSLGPDDIDGNYANFWKIAALLPADRMARGQWAMQMYQGLGLPKRWAIEEGLEENAPEELVRERLMEDWMASPPAMAAAFSKFLQQAGFLPKQGTAQIQGGGGANVAPAMPGGPAGPMGVQPPPAPAPGAMPSQMLVTPNQVQPSRQRGRPAGVGRTPPRPQARPPGPQALR